MNRAPLLREPMEGFFVWTKRGKAPRFHHTTLAAAVGEAERLAAKNPGGKFIVMMAMSKHSVPGNPESSPGSKRGEGAQSSSPHVGAGR